MIFGRGKLSVRAAESGGGDSALANRRAWQRMSEAERLTGRTASELAAEQARLREQMYQRLGRAA